MITVAVAVAQQFSHPTPTVNLQLGFELSLDKMRHTGSATFEDHEENFLP